jgi:mannan endo-1,4-beta-mannosidase
VNTGTSTTIKLWAKDQDGVWRDGGAVPIIAGGLTLSVDVSDLNMLQGFGLQIENFDTTSTNAQFYMDNVKTDAITIFDFENTGDWSFQVNWSPAQGLQLSSDWTVTGNASLSGKTQLVEGDNNIILQTYPEGGIPIKDVTSVSVVAYAKDAGDAVTAQLWVKDQDGVWRDGGAIAMTAEGVTLTVDVSDYEGIQGFGVRYQGAVNSLTPSQYFIDNVVFE